MLRLLLDDLTQREKLIGRLTERIMEVMAAPFAEAVQRLATIPGIDQRAAENILAEIGTDMGQFPSAGHLASWTGMCPGNRESAGKRQSGKTTKGNRWLRATLVQVAWAASHTKGTYLVSAVSAVGRSAGQEAGVGGLGAHDLSRHLPSVKGQDDLPGVGSGLLRPVGPHALEPRVGAAFGSVGA